MPISEFQTGSSHWHNLNFRSFQPVRFWRVIQNPHTLHLNRMGKRAEGMTRTTMTIRDLPSRKCFTPWRRTAENQSDWVRSSRSWRTRRPSTSWGGNIRDVRHEQFSQSDWKEWEKTFPRDLLGCCCCCYSRARGQKALLMSNKQVPTRYNLWFPALRLETVNGWSLRTTPKCLVGS